MLFRSNVAYTSADFFEHNGITITSSTLDNSLFIHGKQLIEESILNTTGDDVSSIGKVIYLASSKKIGLVVAKGTTLADAQTQFAGTPLEYATDPSQTTLPTISYKAPINAAAQRDSNTNAIAQNARILTNHMTKQNAVNLSFDFRITALEP